MKTAACVATLLLSFFASSSARTDDWTLDSDAAQPMGAEWDSSGWKLLGERSVNGRYDHDTISVGSYKGRFEKLSMVVLGSDLELLDFEVRFVSGRPYRPATRHHFREGSRSRIFDLPGSDRAIRSIELRYKNVPGGGNAKVQIWAR
ncbi:MAG TPA: hypothetical protein VLM79_34930 [Kofleriaceae bacterium]|nr:hypothetical protein [Kofleriaceae bacterium]